jgi:LPXTG-site transpeptidase (sortase) family protein
MPTCGVYLIKTAMVFVKQTAQLVRASARAWQHKLGFGAATLLVFLLSVAMLSALDLLPNAPAPTENVTLSRTLSMKAAGSVVELPVSISIPSIKLETVVANPVTTDVATLDGELDKGAVRYPASAKPGEQGNVIVFGHSSYLPLVKNPAYKAFNGIQNLEIGESIIVKGLGHQYVYRVVSVYSANAGTDGIPLTVEGSMLTLATCDSFGKVSDRFIVTAELVESYPLAS